MGSLVRKRRLKIWVRSLVALLYEGGFARGMGAVVRSCGFLSRRSSFGEKVALWGLDSGLR